MYIYIYIYIYIHIALECWAPGLIAVGTVLSQ